MLKRLTIILVVLLAWALPTLAQDDSRSGADESLRIHRDQDKKHSGSGEDGSLVPSDWWRTAGALGIVIALILAGRWLLKRSPSLGKRYGAAGPVEVVHRTSIGPRQQLMLVRLGKRLILIGSSAERLCTLAELKDPQEVAELLDSGDDFGALVAAKARQMQHDADPDARGSSSGDEAGNLSQKLRTLLSKDKKAE